MIGFSPIPECYDDSGAMATTGNFNNSFVLSRIEFTFDMKIP